MKKHSIVLKLFIITMVFFSLFLGIFAVGQTLFFKSFYLNLKTSRLEESMEKFSSMYMTENWDSTVTTRNINRFSDQNNAQIAVMDDKGVAKYVPVYEIVVETSEKNKVKIPLSNIIFQDNFQDLKLEVGAEIDVDGIFSDDLSLVSYLSSIKNGNQKWVNSSVSLFTTGALGQKALAVPVNNTINTTSKEANGNGTALKISSGKVDLAEVKVNYINVGQKTVSGKIVELSIPAQLSQLTSYSKEILGASISYWNQLWMLKKIDVSGDKTLGFKYVNPNNGMENIVLVKPVLKDKTINEFILVVSSLQPVGEAVDVMKDYYIYAIIGALVLIAVMALVFSKTVAKPLIKMNKVAAKMADLDFSEVVSVKSNDELGSLASSLNHLSKNLDISMTGLKAVNEQLKLDIEKEKQLEIMRKDFVSSVSHELKTPLGIIKGYAEGIKDNIVENKKDYYMDVILDEIEKMDELVLDLLDLAKLESGNYQLDLESFYIADILNELPKRFQNRIEEKEIELQFNYEKEDLLVVGDQKRIEQVVTNIFNNAIRHTKKEGYIIISVKEKAQQANIYIENSGNPISEEDLPRIWERFYRSEKSRDRRTGGTGLGLSIVKNILELHESQFGVENTEIGVRFNFTLDVAKS